MAADASAVEMKELGRGRTDRVINLDIGGKDAGIFPYFGAQGFAAPQIPQFAQLSPGVLVYQSKKYRDESMKLYSNARDILNQTKDAEENASRSSQMAAAAKSAAEISANSSQSNAHLCQDYLGETRSVHSEILATGKKAEQLAEKAEDLENITRKNAEDSARYAELAQAYLADMRAEENKVSILAQRFELLEKIILAPDGRERR